MTSSMIRLKDTKCQNTAAFLSSAIHTAEYYGFKPLDTMVRERLRAPASTRKESEMAFARRDERQLFGSAKLCVACVRNPNETLFIWRLIKNSKDRSGLPGSSLELHVIGAPHAMAEALLIIVADAIAADAGLTERVLLINSIGSTESSNRFIRDVGTFLRKHVDSI